MKAVFIGDAHFGSGYAYGKIDSATGLNTRLLDYEKTLSNIIDFIINNKIEVCVFLGDIFETKYPTPQQLMVFYRQLMRLSLANITTYLISGNHDYTKARFIYTSLDPLKQLNIPNIHIYTDIDLVQFTDSHNETINLLLMPYRNRQCYDKHTNEEAIAEMTKEIQSAKGKAKEGSPIILLGHMMMSGTIPADAGEYLLNELVLPFDMFEGIDAVINGHIHRCSILKENPVFIYSGSMECKDFGEREHQKAFILYDSSKTGIDAFTFKAIKTRKFINIEIDYSSNFPEDPMKEVIAEIDKNDVKDAVVKVGIRVPEKELSIIDIELIRKKLYADGVSCLTDVSVVPVISKQFRSQKVQEAPDDISAFKHYITSQGGVEAEALDLGLQIIKAENNGAN